MNMMDLYRERLEKAEKSGDFDRAMRLCVYLAFAVMDRNRAGRALDRAVYETLDGETRENLYRRALRESANLERDPYTSDDRAHTAYFLDVLVRHKPEEPNTDFEEGDE